ncbi:receptor expression-enhancing protein 5-like [Myzus persicae]|uniref:receptor expression-enhancing protein 5-like n=1 Tax=Myzus persicae TaxID=13164 RepID=UPI000B93092B|nr:receptor expression-enhancing protein 5-like [Myzus persicae]
MFGILAFVTETALMMLEPVYLTYKGLEAVEAGEGSLDPEQWRRLLVHWIVYGAFRAVEGLARPWVPFYDVVKICAIVWLRAGGSDTVYQTIIRPFLVEHEPDIDMWIDQLNRTRDSVVAATTVISAAVTGDPDATDDGEPGEVTQPEPEPVSGGPAAASPAVPVKPTVAVSPAVPAKPTVAVSPAVPANTEPPSPEPNEEQRRKDQ